MRISDWSSDVCSSEIAPAHFPLWIHRLLTAADVSISYFVYIRRLSLLSCDRLRGRNNSREKGESNEQGFLQKADSVSSRVYDDRSEERRVGKACVRTCRFGGSRNREKKKKN